LQSSWASALAVVGERYVADAKWYGRSGFEHYRRPEEATANKNKPATAA
jgi:hypothetical protein